MSHPFKESLPLLLYDDLESRERELLEEHLKGCAECRDTLEELKQLHSFVPPQAPVEPSEEFLREVQWELELALRKEHSGPTERSGSARTNWFYFRMPVYAAACAAFAALAVGVFLSWLLLPEGAPPSVVVENNPLGAGNLRIENVRFLDADASDGEIEFAFEAVSPIRLRGSLDDAKIQRVLTYALVNEQNPGVRLRAVKAIQSRQEGGSDSKVKEALIAALESDENPGVRTEALRVLQEFPYDEAIKNAFLHVLVNDSNSGLRIAAINSLEAAAARSQSLGPDVREVLKEKMQSDENDYVRIRATNLLREIRQ